MQWSWVVNVVIVVYGVISAWRGYREGVFIASANLVGLIVSVIVAFWLYQPLADWLLTIWSIPPGLMNIFAFLLVAFVVDGVITALVLVGSNYLGPRLLQATSTHIAGIIPGTLNALITTAYVAALISALPLNHPIKTAVSESFVAKPLIRSVQSFSPSIDQLINPAIKDISQLFIVEPGSDETVDLGFTVQNPTLAPQAEEQMLALVNQARAGAGVRPVVMDNELRNLARLHSLDMYQRGYFSHHTPEGLDPFDRMKQHNIDYLAAGENLAMAPTVDMAHTGLMNSPGHKRNILDPKYGKIGIGAYQDPRYVIMFSQEFTN